MEHIIKNEYLTIVIQNKGAMLCSVKDRNNNEYLWQGTAPYWNEKAPNLFPFISGMTDGKYTLGGNEYEIGFHGFAKNMEFEADRISDSHISFSIRDTEETYKEYPFHFRFSVIYRLEGSKVFVTYYVKNNDDKEMFFAVGGHPGFYAPLDKNTVFEDWYLEFDAVKNAKRVQLSDECLVTGKTEKFPLVEGVKLPLHHDIFDSGAILLTDISDSVTLRADNSNMALRVTYSDMPYLGIWQQAKADAPYICIEPWSSLPARYGIIEDLRAQPGLISLKPELEYKNSWSIEIFDLL